MTTTRNEIRFEKIGTLNELIEATRDSANFYTDAAKSVDNPELRRLFDHMASSKNGLVGSMSKEVRAEGAEPAKAGTFRGALREVYEEVRTSMGREKSDYSYVSELEKSEDQLMEAFHDVIKSDSAPKEVKESLRSYLPTVQAHHDTLRDRKWKMEARH
ncbi:PA2169 family four-helix-bundle protein [Dokdonella sp.]|uniref:PA2169 family four-helix-bundle protein n=1 Tax=Dokdonella sp. TaxID=2291710 RepID=UPI00352788D2